MTSSTAQQQAFQDRINRIREKQGQPPLPNQVQRQAQLKAEADAAIPQPKARPKSQVSPVPSIWENIGYPASIVGAFLLGAVAVLASNYAMFHLFNGNPITEDPLILMVGNGALAAGISFVFKSAMKFEGKEFNFANTAGIIAMVTTIHNLFHFFPGIMAGLYSTEHVLMMLDWTVPYSISYGGDFFVLSEEIPPASNWTPQAAAPAAVQPVVPEAAPAPTTEPGFIPLGQ